MTDPADRAASPAPEARANPRVTPSRTERAPGAQWRRFLTLALLLLGAALLLSGVISFFAFNWATLGRLTKFALLEGGLAVCALVGWWRLREVTGRVALSAAAILVGPLLGVFGQAYQTGADAWGLFAAWALLIAPWVIVAEFTPLWIVEVALCDVALALFWGQVLGVNSSEFLYLFSVLAGLHAIAVAAWEWQWHRETPWLRARHAAWAPRLLVAVAFGFLLVPAIALVLNGLDEGPARTFGFFAFCLAVAVTLVVYRRVRADLFMLTVAGGSVLFVLTVAFARLLFSVLKLDITGGLLMAMFVLVEVVVAVAWLRRSVRPEAEEAALGTTASDAPAHAAAAGPGPAATEAPMPWYLRFLIGAGAWVGASFLLSAILSLILLASGERMNSVAFVIGSVFMIASILLRRRVNTTFLTQLALVISSAGQILVIGAVGSAASSVIAGSMAAIVSSLVLIVWYPDRVQRFSATLVAFGSLLVVIVDHPIAHGMDALALVLLALTLGLWRFTPRKWIEERADLVEPVIYGLVIALLGVLTTHTIVTIADIREVSSLRLGPVSIVAFIVALLALAAAIFAEHGVALFGAEPLAAFTGIVLLGTITRRTPAIVATVLLLVLTFDRGARVLMSLATVFFIGFGAAFYYDLELTLLQKSIILMLSGALCLTAWAVVRPRGAPRAGSADAISAESGGV